MMKSLENSILGLMLTIAPILAPIIGGWINFFYGWRAIFLFMTVFGVIFVLISFFRIPETLEIKNITEGYTKEQIEQNIEQFTEDRNEALYDLYEMKRETLAFNEGGNKYGYLELLDDTDFFTPVDFTDTYNVKGYTDEQVVEILEGMI